MRDIYSHPDTVSTTMLCLSLHPTPPLQERERKHLAEFLEDYDDVKDDQRYYKYGILEGGRGLRKLKLEVA